MRKIMALAGLMMALATPAAAENVTIACELKQIIRAADAKAENLQLQLRIDTVEGTAEVVNEKGPDEVKLIRGQHATTFMQLFPSGEIRTTTISDAGRAAHTRHAVDRGEVVPTLYHGNCK